ncbi:MAG: hypothetical protein JJ693_06380 [Acidithiobacillus sp.]|nr:hypothetical protein [Acidithiobacillus sp.]
MSAMVEKEMDGRLAASGSLRGRAVTEFLLQLQASGQGLAVSDVAGGKSSTARIERLGVDRMQLAFTEEGQNRSNILVSLYQSERSAHFLLHDGKPEGNLVWTYGYPEQIQVQKNRQNLRYTLLEPVQAIWQPSSNVQTISGDVIDISLGGFLASIFVSTGIAQGPAFACEEGSEGRVLLHRGNGTSWQGEAVLRRKTIFRNLSENHTLNGTEPSGFILLGFAFQFHKNQDVQSMAAFFQGILGPVA